MARYQETQFAALRLTAEDKDQFEQWFDNQDMRLEDIIEQFGTAGFKMSAIYVDEKAAWCFSIIGTIRTKRHDKMVLTSWSDMLTEAAAIAFYKHFILLQGAEWPTEDTRNNWG